MLSLENLLIVFWELGPGVGEEIVSLSESSTDSVSVTNGFFVVIFEAIGVYSSFLGGKGSQVPSLCNTISCSSAGNRGDLISSMKNPSTSKFSMSAGLLQTGQTHLGFFSFICR